MAETKTYDIRMSYWNVARLFLPYKEITKNNLN